MTDPAPTPTLPASDYLDPVVWEAEIEDVIRRGWVPICRLDQIARSGDRYATTIAGHPVVAVRDGDEVRVLTNVCQHRWSTVAEPGCSQGRNLVCPYHRWSYRLDGRLQAAPLAGAFSARRRGPARDPPRGLAGLRHGQPGRRGRATRPVRGRPHRDPRPLAGRRAGHGGQPDLSLQLELEGHGRELDRVLPPPRLPPGHGRVPEPGPDHPHRRNRRAMDLHDRRHRPRRRVPTRAMERPDGARGRGPPHHLGRLPLPVGGHRGTLLLLAGGDLRTPSTATTSPGTCSPTPTGPPSGTTGWPR